MNFDETKNKLGEFLEKCRKDLDLIIKKLDRAIKENDRQGIELYCYEHSLCSEIYDILKCNRGGVGYFIKFYNDLESPLIQIFDDRISYFTEPKLITENKLYQLIDKIEERRG